MTKRLFGFMAVLFSLPVQAEVYVQAVIPLIDGDAQILATKYSYYDLTLTKGEELVVDIRVQGGLDNSMTVWLLNLANFQKFTAGQRFSYYEGGSSADIRAATSYTFTVPEDNIYYLILDNRAAVLAPRTATTSAYKIVNGETEESKKTYDYYAGLDIDLLKKLFIFEDFDIYVQKCGMANAFSAPDIYICRELNDLLIDQDVPEALLFVFLHEAAHSLLNVWDYPLYDNEDAADELATALLLFADQKESALGAAKWWASRGSADEALAKMWVDDRHTISAQRARNIINWINDDEELIRRWLHLMIPKMTDEVLQFATNDEEIEGSHATAVRHELLKREALLAQQ